MSKFKALSALTITALFTAPIMAAPTAAKLTPEFKQGESLIQTMTKGQAEVTDTFTPAGTDLQGYVIEPKHGGPGQIVFSNKGKYLIIGNVITPQGVNLTEKYTKDLIQSKVAKKAYEEISHLKTITDGKDSAKHKLYIIIDPNCIFCHLMYEELNKSEMVKKGDLQIKWLPIGFLKPSSLGKAAAMFTAKNPLRALIKDERAKSFNVKREEGGLKALDQNTKDPTELKAFATVKKNTAFFTKNGFGGTPTLLFKTDKGQYDYVAGFVKGKQLEDLVKTLSSKW